MDQIHVPQTLADILKSMKKAAVAFSGGVDSSYLLYAANAYGVDVRAYYVNSQFQPQFELEDAQKIAREVGVSMTVIPLDVLSDETVRANPEDRCYHCKRVIFKTIIEAAQADGYTAVMDGSNFSDDSASRPGMRALSELKVLSPLRQAGLTKAQIREYSRKAGLFTWDKPAYACLATRIPTGDALQEEMLLKVEKAEAALAELGFSDFRARVLGSAVKLQFPKEQIINAAKRHEELLELLSPLFSDVLLDLKPR